MSARGWRRTTQLRGVALIGWMVTVVLVVVAWKANTTAAAIIAGALAICLGFASLRCQLAGVRPEQRVVTIRGPLRTWHVAWSQLDSFSFEALGAFPAVGVANLRDGTKLPISGLSTGRVDSPKAREEADIIIAELNRLLEERRAS